ncbi:MAG TPA: acetyl-CoA acetyltransferase [Spirochaetota bacterium]|nr:acetyl-CoA acetyltransferase [Spirochaetota bacterium]HOM10814.1 acetyl-CoA acetyltransferase [Spirochaetota bacterium]HPP50661.1 acetyl-CoA acetyltransferase [Spirochaetota bacterium]
MKERVAIVGIGVTGFSSVSPSLSFKELTYTAAVKAYHEAGLHPKEIDSFITASEDFMEGYSIFDEYVPDQMGAVMRPVQTVTADFIQALGIGCMMINTGRFRTIAVEAHSKASNVKTLNEVKAFALDPVYIRPLKENADFLAGLEMKRFLEETGNTEEQCAEVIVKNKANALNNPYAAHAASLTIDDVLSSPPISLPLKELDAAKPADGAIMIVLASEKEAKALCKKPIWIRGISWFSGQGNPWCRDFAYADYAQLAAQKAFAMAGIANPLKDLDFAEICDEYSYKELQHLESIGIARKGEAGFLTQTGVTKLGGLLPVNVSGGSLGVGHTYEASGGMKVVEAVMQLRHEAGIRQIPNAKTGLVQSWRGVPTATGAIALLSNE